MSLFDNLPQETLRRIFELIRVEWDPDNLSYKLIGVGKSAETLAQLALVSKSWRVEAQGVLFKVVYLSSKERLEQFIKSPALTRYKVRALTLHGSDVEKQRINPTQVAQALNKIKGLRSLEISSIKGQNAGLLVHPSLTELTQLDVSVTISYNGSKVANLPAPPYRHGLTSLRLWAFKIVPSAEVLRPIFAISATTLKMLKIVVTRETSEILSSVLPLVAASLTYLSLECLNNFPPSFLAALNQCTALKSLQYNVFMPDSLAYLKGALENVPTKLDRLLIDAGKDIDEAAYLACLQDPKSTQNLKTLVAFGSNQNKYKIPVSIGRECESRGIEFMTGVSRYY